MGNNGTETKLILQVEIKDNKFNVKFGGGVNLALISHGIRLANLQLDNSIIAMNVDKEEEHSIVQPIIKPDDGFMNRFVR